MALILSMFGALILGMGLPTLPAYLIIAIMLAPAIEKAGVPSIAAHMFVLYFAVYSSIVPPIAYACYVAAPIAGSTPMRTAVQALRISAVGLLVPYVFVFNPSLLLVVSFDAGLFVWVIMRLLLAVWLTATGFGGADMGGLLPLPERFLRVVLGLMTLIPVPILEIGGFDAGLAVIAYRLVRRRTRSGPDTKPHQSTLSREET